MIEPFSHAFSLRSNAANRRFRCEELIAIKIPPKDGVLTSIFRRNYKVDLFNVVDIPPGENDILVMAGKFNDIKDSAKARAFRELSLNYDQKGKTGQTEFHCWLILHHCFHLYRLIRDYISDQDQNRLKEPHSLHQHLMQCQVAYT